MLAVAVIAGRDLFAYLELEDVHVMWHLHLVPQKVDETGKRRMSDRERVAEGKMVPEVVR